MSKKHAPAKKTTAKKPRKKRVRSKKTTAPKERLSPSQQLQKLRAESSSRDEDFEQRYGFEKPEGPAWRRFLIRVGFPPLEIRSLQKGDWIEKFGYETPEYTYKRTDGLASINFSYSEVLHSRIEAYQRETGEVSPTDRRPLLRVEGLAAFLDGEVFNVSLDASIYLQNLIAEAAGENNIDWTTVDKYKVKKDLPSALSSVLIGEERKKTRLDLTKVRVF